MNTHITTPPRIAHPSAPAQEAAVLLKPRQLARRPGISRRTLSNWTQNKTVPMIKIGRFCRFEFDKVWATLQKHEQAAAGALDVLERLFLHSLMAAKLQTLAPGPRCTPMHPKAPQGTPRHHSWL